jgi:hypothetical protein
MPAHIARGNTTRARVRSRVEHAFAAQKCRLGLIVRTVGMVRARAKIGMADLVYNFTRLAWLQARTAPATHTPLRSTSDKPHLFAAVLIGPPIGTISLLTRRKFAPPMRRNGASDDLEVQCYRSSVQ